MKLTNAIKKLEKSGHTVAQTGRLFRVESNGTALEFYEQDARIICISTCSLSIEKDRCVMTDYFPATFHDNLSQAMRWL